MTKRKLRDVNGIPSTFLETGKLHGSAPVRFEQPSRVTNSTQREPLILRHQNIRAGAEQDIPSRGIAC